MPYLCGFGSFAINYVTYKYEVKTGVAAVSAETVADANLKKLDEITVATNKEYETIYVVVQDGAAPEFYPVVPTTPGT